MRAITGLRNSAARQALLAGSGQVDGRRHDDSLTSTRRTVAGQMERSRCRLGFLVRFSGPLHIVGCGGTRPDLQSSPCSSTLPSLLPFAKAKLDTTLTIGMNSETATSTHLERHSFEHEKSNIKRETVGTWKPEIRDSILESANPWILSVGSRRPDDLTGRIQSGIAPDLALSSLP